MADAKRPNGRILFLDIETAPTVADVWSLRNNFVGINQIKVHPRTIGFAYMWEGQRRPTFISEYHHSHKEMVETARHLLDEADAMVGYNSEGFDARHLNSEFVEAGLTPPSPYHHIDLYKTVKANFRWPSFKLQYVLTRLDLGSKLQHTGHQLWADCLGEDGEAKDKAWALMKRYCIQDVAVLPVLKDRLNPWLKTNYNAAVFASDEVCASCASTNLQYRGWAVTKTRRYQRFQCQDCGRWGRRTNSTDGVNVT